MRAWPILFLLFALPFAAQARDRDSGDWSSTGGGSGVACFANIGDAKRADPFIESGKTLSPELLAHAKLQVLECWEAPHTNTPLISVKPNATWQEIHRDTRTLIAQVAPLFANRLEIAGGYSDYARWEQTDTLSLLDDANPVAPLPENCRRIQLVLRYSDGDQPHSPTPNRVAVKVVFNKIYFDHLSAIDQAMLVLHEELYVMGKAIGHPTSDHIRGFVRIFFSDSFVRAHTHDEPPFLLQGEGDVALRNALITFFGDYVEFFVNDDKPVSAAPFTSRHHFQTFMAYVRRKRDLVVQCRHENPSSAPMECTDKFMNPKVVSRELNEEESFIYLSDFYLEQSAHIFNYDYVMRAQDDDDAFTGAMLFSCEEMRNLRAVPLVKPIKDKAVSYCKAWNKNRSR